MRGRWWVGLAGALLACRAWGADYYVATNAVPAAPHDSWANAFTNLQEALDAAADGDSVYVAGQTFRVATQLLWSARTGVSLSGGFAATNALDKPGPRDPAAWPTVFTRVTGVYSRILFASGVTNGILDGVALRGGDLYTNGAGMLLTQCSNLWIGSCEFSGHTARTNSAAAVYGGGLYLSGYNSVTFSNCAIVSNTVLTERYVSANGGGLAVGAGSSALLADCVIRYNVARNPSISANQPAAGGGLWNGGTTVIRNGLLDKNECYHAANSVTFELGDGAYGSAGLLILENCTVAFNYGQGVYRAGGTLALTNCIVWGNGLSTVGTLTKRACDIQGEAAAGDNLSADPLFTFGYYLDSGSPCLNAGTGGGGLAASPYTTRPDGAADAGAVDLGYHYRSGFDRTWENLYVSPGGSDAADGLGWGTAKRTIGAAAALARDGSRIWVAAGVYTNKAESFPIYIGYKNGVWITGTNRAETVLRAGRTNQLVKVEHAPGFRLQGLTLFEGEMNGNGGGISLAYAPGDSRITDCVITNNRTIGGTRYGGGVYIGPDSEVTISNCLVVSNSVGTDYQCGGGGVYVAYRARALLRESALLRNSGITWHSGIYGGGLWNAGGTAVVVNCVVAGNFIRYGGGNNGYENGHGIYASGITVLENCTVASNGNKGVHAGTGTTTVRNSILWGNTNDVMGTAGLEYSVIGSGANNGTNGCTSANPLFVNEGAGDYRLRSAYGRASGTGTWIFDPVTSPCVDTGTNQAWMTGSVDMDGLARLAVGRTGNKPARVDMGAFESHPKPENPRGTVVQLQ